MTKLGLSLAALLFGTPVLAQQEGDGGAPIDSDHATTTTRGSDGYTPSETNKTTKKKQQPQPRKTQPTYQQPEEEGLPVPHSSSRVR